MILKRFTVGPLETNSYVFGDEDSKEAVLIDPGGESGRIKDFLKKEGLRLKCIINTHGHGDHIAGNRDFKTDILVHKNDSRTLADPEHNLSSAFGVTIVSPAAAKILNEGDVIAIGRLKLEVIHTPGHTPGGICLRCDGILFSGDTLFFEGVGRADLPNSSEKDLFASIKNKLLSLPDDCKVYPGHGPETTIGHERRYNPFLR